MPIKDVAYQIRVKKEIDRRLFAETLRLISKFFDLEKYAYAGMAGPFSEDFKLMHDRFNFQRMFSYEIDEDEYKRQLFNAPIDCIVYNNDSIAKFIDDYPSLIGKSGAVVNLKEVVLWLDYTGMIGEKVVDEYLEAVSKVENGSVIRITVQAHISNVAEKHDNENMEELRNRRKEILRDSLGRYFYEDEMLPNRMTNTGYPKAIYETLRIATFSKLIGTDSIFLPLTAYVYQDGVKMLTFTGIKLKKGNKTKFLNETGFKNWKYGLFKNTEPIIIDVGTLSLKEKYELDSKPLSRTTRKLDYFPEKTKKSYKFLSKFYPTYAKII